MPRLRTSRSTPPPEGFDEMEPILEEYDRKMRDAETEDTDAISRELYDWLLKYQYADAK
ncbi:related to G10 protein [Ustilago bromivora]|uniref:Related to G10 protein n=1 Tax=Ustilago bromivora TaxID=307758 RepID=A0A8H8TTX7_9BASI|nr:related to G10 protein [Ustilago bromivora]